MFLFLTLYVTASAVPIQGTGLTFNPADCELRSERKGQPGTLFFSEMSFDCSGLELRVEVTRPLDDGSYKRHLANQAVRFQEAYSAGRNPYTGFISGTTKCPSEKNYASAPLKTPLQEIRLHIGRLSERGAWGGCGMATDDRWGATATFHLDSALIDVTIKSREKIARQRFRQRAESVLRGLEKK